MSEARADSLTFGQVALEHIDSLYGYALTLTHDQTEAEDLVQETYLRAVRAFDRLTDDENLKSWLFVIMRNAWLNQVRHNRSGPRFIELDGEESGPNTWRDQQTHDPHAIYLRKLERAEITAAIKNLPTLYREIIILRDVQGFSYHEIATMLGCPAGTVMSRLGRARERLRRSLDGCQPTKALRAV